MQQHLQANDYSVWLVVCILTAVIVYLVTVLLCITQALGANNVILWRMFQNLSSAKLCVILSRTACVVGCNY